MGDSDRTTFRLSLIADAGAAAAGRAFVAEHAGRLLPDLVEDALLLVSELVTNAVLHGRPDITLHMSLHPPTIRVSVHDQGVAIPSTIIAPQNLDAFSGRGLMIVDRVSSRWGVIPTDPPPGKTVWFQLDNPSP